MLRREAKELGLKRYASTKPCPKGHLAERYVTTGRCCICTTSDKAKLRKERPDKISEYNKTAKANFGKEAVRKYNKAYKKANRPLMNALGRKYELCKIQRTPKWSDPEKILEVYKECERISKETGILHQVDHIVPLKGKLVSGLHVSWNLQILKASENASKKNKFEII